MSRRIKIIDDRKFNFFQVENDLIDREDLTSYEKLVYMILIRYSNKNDDCYPSYDTIAKKAGISRPTAIKAIKSLEKKKLLKKKIRLLKNKNENATNLYTIGSAALGSKGDLPPSKGDLPPSKGDLPKQDLLKNTNLKRKTTTPEKNVVAEEPSKKIKELKSEIENTIDAKVTVKAVEKLTKESNIDTIRLYLSNWNKFDVTSKRNIAGFFIDAVLNKYEIPKQAKSKDNKKGHANFDQREYPDSYYDAAYKTF